MIMNEVQRSNLMHRNRVHALITLSRTGSTLNLAALGMKVSFYDLLALTTFRDWKDGETVELTPRGAHRLAKRLAS